MGKREPIRTSSRKDWIIAAQSQCQMQPDHTNSARELRSTTTTQRTAQLTCGAMKRPFVLCDWAVARRKLAEWSERGLGKYLPVFFGPRHTTGSASSAVRKPAMERARAQENASG